jgi:pentatricopeptide repeat protein
MTDKGIAGIRGGVINDAKEFVQFTNSLKNANATAEFFAHLRILHGTVKGTKDAYATILDAMEDIDKLLGYQEIPGVAEFDSGMTEEVAELFDLMSKNGFKIDEIISETTKQFSSNSAILEHFNEELVQYDMFKLNMNADIRYENSRSEMLLAVNSIIDTYSIQETDRNEYINNLRDNCFVKNDEHLKKIWAVKTKYLSRELDGSLEVMVKNFSAKLRGQIEMKEKFMHYTSDIACLDSAVHWNEKTLQYTNGVFSSKPFSTGAVIYDINIKSFREHAEKLVKKYY